MSEDDNKPEAVEFQAMPGADIDDQEPAEAFDLNFGLGEEPADETESPEALAEEAVEDEEAPVAEAEEESEPETEDEELVAPISEAEESDGPVFPSPTEPEAVIKPPKKIPKSRFDEVLAKNKALQKQVDDLLASQTPAEDAPEEYNFAEKEVEYQNLLLDGDSQKAAELRAEIRRAERTQIEYEMTQKMTQTVNQSQQANALQQAASELEANFPVFDAKSDQYNEEYTQEVIDLRDAFIVKGENPVLALSKAAKYVINEYSLVDTVEETTSLAGNTAPKAKQVDEVSKKRAEVSRKLKAADAQPPELPGESSASRGESAFNLSNLSEEEFDALPEATLKRLRGDIL